MACMTELALRISTHTQKLSESYRLNDYNDDDDDECCCCCLMVAWFFSSFSFLDMICVCMYVAIGSKHYYYLLLLFLENNNNNKKYSVL